MNKKWDVWIDNVKVIACVLVVLGHFFQSMLKSNLIPDSFLYNWFNDTIYYFHVPLFFICSGYLYQKYSHVDTFYEWRINVLKKFICLGIPYFVFSISTWVLKKIFSSSVNSQLGGIGDTLFKHPASPYWYLYILFFLFVITMTTRNVSGQLIMMMIALVLRVLYSLHFFSPITNVYLVDKVLANWFWFVFGMTISYNVIKLVNVAVGIVLVIVFLAGSTIVEMGLINHRFFEFALALLACYAIVSIVYSIFSDGAQSKYWSLGAKYTMPIFLMHTLFAATLRSILMKIGVNNSLVHIVFGLIISFCGPVLAMIILEKIKPLDFIVYPARYIKLKKKEF